jgi:heat-inducible transcriptional repressor
VLTERQELVLRRVVEAYLDEPAPVGSKLLSEGFAWGPSTIRHELASLEELGLLAHPHTSAGRVPTEAGYRYFVDRLLPAEQASVPPLALSLVRHEVEEAMRITTETLSQITSLLAIVTAPPLQTATIRHVEVLTLQPQMLMVVVITSTGGVTKRIFTFDRPVDQGLADWAGSYLNERLVGTGLGARRLGQRLMDPSLTTTELNFLASLAPVFTELSETQQDGVYFDGTAHLLAVGRGGAELSELNSLVEMLERRVSMLSALRSALGDNELTVRIGAENDQPALRSLAVVAASYGLPQRTLGAVSVIGPVWMDYPQVIPVVREAAAQLSSFVTDVYDER